MKSLGFFIVLLSFSQPSLASNAPSNTLSLKETWLCMAQDRAGESFTSGFTENLGGAQKQALEFCYSFSTMPATCRLSSCEKTG